MFIDIDARIDVGTEITNRSRWKNGVAIDDDRIEGASNQATSRAQPDELRFRSRRLLDIQQPMTSMQ